MAARHMPIGLLATLVAGQPALAQAPWPTTASSAQPCARERALAAAEDTTPGILQRLTADSLAECLAAVFSAPGAAPSSGPDAAARPNMAIGAEGAGR